jgi:hypothetical protein
MDVHRSTPSAAEPPAGGDTGREGQDGAEQGEQISHVRHYSSTFTPSEAPQKPAFSSK